MLTMSNSALATYRNVTKNKNSPRKSKIDTITIHCMAGQMTGRGCADYFASTTRQVSSNYCVGYDGSIAVSVDEKDRSWCSCSPSNDHRAITIEVATDSYAPYKCTDKAYAALLDLVEDICRRNGIEKLQYTGNTDGNMTKHKWFANTACPGTYLEERFVEIQREVNRRLAGDANEQKEKDETAAAAGMNGNYLTYPVRYMRITQNVSGGTSHKAHSTGSPADYPIDEACSDGGRDWFCCPANGMRVAHIRGVGDGGTNTIWLESTAPVIMPCGTDYVTIQVIHPNDDTLKGIREGQIFRRGEKMFLEGNDGNATGYHFHIAVGSGKFKGTGWVLNNKNAWVNDTTGRQLRPEEAFFVDPAFTTIMDAAGIDFKKLPGTSEKQPAAPMYRVQIGAYSVKANAAAQEKKAKAAGFSTVIKEAVVSGKTIYRVQIGAFGRKENAEAFAEKARGAGFGTVIVDS